MKIEIEVCDHCGRKPKAGLSKVEGKLRDENRTDDSYFKEVATLCLNCRTRVVHFMERAFAAASKES